MNMYRRFESISGLGAAILGILALAYALFGQIYRGTGSSGQSGTASLLQIGIQPITIAVLAVLLLALIGLAISSALHSSTGETGWRVILGISAFVIVLVTLLTLPSIGLFLLPSALLALGAFILSFFVRRIALG